MTVFDFTVTRAADIENMAREFARKIIAAPGWAAELDAICAAARDMLMATVESIAGTPAMASVIADRIEEILREFAGGDFKLIAAKYFDLLPDNLQATLRVVSFQVLRDCGATLTEFKDETGATFIKLSNIGDLAALEEEVARLVSVAPKPVGELRRVQ